LAAAWRAYAGMARTGGGGPDSAPSPPPSRPRKVSQRKIAARLRVPPGTIAGWVLGVSNIPKPSGPALPAQADLDRITAHHGIAKYRLSPSLLMISLFIAVVI
jgi:hypothetical protein